MPNPFYVSIKVKGKNPWQWFKEVNDKIHFEFQESLVELGEQTAIRMGDIIRASAKRPLSGRLEESIKSEIISSTGGVHIGIGKISELPPYWEVLNDGGYVPPSNVGYFPGHSRPTSGGGGELWTHTGNTEEDFLMRPIKPIQPVRYIDISAAELKISIELEINKLMSEV